MVKDISGPRVANPCWSTRGRRRAGPLDLRIWIAITIVFAAQVAVLLVLMRDERLGHFLLEVPVPFVMILLR